MTRRPFLVPPLSQVSLPEAPETRPDFRRGYLRVPLRLWKNLFCRGPLTRRQLQLVAVVLRESWGWRDGEHGVRLWTRPLTTADFARATGLATDHLARDLRCLVTLGVLRSRDRRYQLVADPGLWITPEGAPEERGPALKSPALSAESAPSPPGLKIEKYKSRKETEGSRREFSPPGDNPREDNPRVDATTTERFLRVLRELWGPFPPEEEVRLRLWVEAAGPAAVWETLGPHLASRRGTAPRALAGLLDDHAPRSGEGAGAGRGEAAPDA